jgi:dTDP-4-amino-4,6-dideoxygalactose transaminase
MVPRLSPNYDFREIWRCFLPARRNASILLEQKFCERTGHQHGYFFNYGRTGLYYLLKALAAKGKNVVVSDYTCVVVPHAIIKAGCEVKLVDTDSSTSPLCTEKLLDAIDENTCMVIITHLYGITVESEQLYKKIKSTNPSIFVLQDMAHSFFCKDANGNVVSKWGDGALFGMNISKLANSVRGGVLTLRDSTYRLAMESIIDKLQTKPATIQMFLRSLYMRGYVLAASIMFSHRFYGVLYFLQKRTRLLNKHTDYFNEKVIDLPNDCNMKPSHFQAEIGLLSMHKLNQRIKNRRAIVETYSSILQDIVKPQPGYTWSHFPALIEGSERTRTIKVYEDQHRTEIGTIINYKVSSLAIYKKMYNLNNQNCQSYASSVINLPLTIYEGLAPVRNSTSFIKKIAEEYNKQRTTCSDKPAQD